MDATRKATIDENHSEGKKDKKRSECIKQQRNIVCLNGAVADELEGEGGGGGEISSIKLMDPANRAKKLGVRFLSS